MWVFKLFKEILTFHVKSQVTEEFLLHNPRKQQSLTWVDIFSGSLSRCPQ